MKAAHGAIKVLSHCHIAPVLPEKHGVYDLPVRPRVLDADNGAHHCVRTPARS